jgi:hypothetical protein
MLKLVIGLVVVAAVAALFGFGVMGDYSWDGARKLCYVALALAAALFVFGGGLSRRTS